jgi:hypothetical protein
MRSTSKSVVTETLIAGAGRARHTRGRGVLEILQLLHHGIQLE